MALALPSPSSSPPDWTVLMVNNLNLSLSEVLLSLVLLSFVILAELCSFLIHFWADSLPISANVVRTPLHNFEISRSLGFKFQPNYLKLPGIPRIHYLDEGPTDSDQVLLLLHGEPFWSFCWTKVIPGLSRHARVIVPDLVGYGLSDKYQDWRMYNLDLHKRTLAGLMNHLGIDGSKHQVTLVGHNWGWMVGAALAREKPSLFSKLVILNTNNLPDGEADVSRYQSLSTWSRFMVINSFFLAFRSSINLLRGYFPLGLMMKSLNHNYSKAEVEALVSPWPSSEYCGGTTAFPLMVPVFPSHPEAKEMTLIRSFLSTWQKPVLIMYSESSLLPWIEFGDFVVGRRSVFYQLLIPGVVRVRRLGGEVGHLVMYDDPGEVVREVLQFVQ
jgi:haloalkane dehalogenase